MKAHTILIAVVSLALAASCGKKDDDKKAPAKTPATETPDKGKTPEVKKPSGPGPAVAKLKGTEGNEGVTGKIEFSEKKGTVSIIAQIKGLTPGHHGFHIHETGDCSAPDGTSAGGHFNPGTTEHGSPSGMKRHAGDFGNLTVGTDGKAEKVITSTEITLGAGDNSIMGKAIIVHANADDFKTQPSGNAGPRVACGVIAPPE